MQHWYVYYKLDRADAIAWVPGIRRMQESIGRATGVRTRLLRRTDDAEQATLLEVYEQIAEPDAFARTLAEAVDRAGLPATIIAQRRSERFEEL